MHFIPAFMRKKSKSFGPLWCLLKGHIGRALQRGAAVQGL